MNRDGIVLCRIFRILEGSSVFMVSRVSRLGTVTSLDGQGWVFVEKHRTAVERLHRAVVVVVDRLELGDLVPRKLGRRSPDVPLHTLAAGWRRERTAVVVDAGGIAGEDVIRELGRNLNRRRVAGRFGELRP